MSMLNEMFENDDELNEARPYSRSQSAIDSAKGKVKGMFGSGQIEQGAQEVGAEANRLWSEFKRYIGRKYGKSQSSVPYADVARFFQGNGLDISPLGNNQRRSFTPKDVGTALLQSARQNMDMHSNEELPQEQQPKQGQGNPQPQGQGEPPEQSQPEVQQPQASSIAGQLQSLSPEERAQLLRMIA